MTRQCSHHYGTNALRVNFSTAFRIHLIENGTKLYFKNSKRILFRIIIADGANARCINIAAKHAAILLRQFEIPAGILSACVLDPIENGTVSPLHFISFNVQRNNVWLNESDKRLVSGVLSAAVLSGFLIALAASVALMRCQSWLRPTKDDIDGDDGAINHYDCVLENNEWMEMSTFNGISRLPDEAWNDYWTGDESD